MQVTSSLLSAWICNKPETIPYMIFITLWTNHYRIIRTLKWLRSLKYTESSFFPVIKVTYTPFRYLKLVFQAGNDYFCLWTGKGMDCLMVNNVWPIWLCSMTKLLNLWIRESSFLNFSQASKHCLAIILCTRRIITGQEVGLAGWIAGVCPGFILFNICLSQSGEYKGIKVSRVCWWH